MRNEKELLNGLFNVLKNQINNNFKHENIDIEQYRDDDGFINLTKENDMNKIKEVVDTVNKKNMTEANNDKNFIKQLTEELLPLFGVESLVLNIETPEGKTSFELGNTKEETNSDNNFKIKNEITEENASEICNNDNDEVDDETFNEDEIIEEDEASMETVVVLHDVGGMYNPAFYNSVLYICETQHFEKCGVYAEDEIMPDEIDVHILLPNIWGKMYAGAVEEFSEVIANGKTVFVVDPETFELTKITEPIDLWNYSMTKVQEDSL